MPKKDKQASHSDAADAAVKLKPLLGVRPGVYLTAIYAVVLALIVFFLLLYPGIRNRGAYVSFTTYPAGASVVVDGTFAGSTPCTIFVKGGRRQIEMRKAFYASLPAPLDVPGRVFGTLIVPVHSRASYTLTVSDLAGLLDFALRDFARDSYIPQVISDAALAARRPGNAPEAKAALYDFVEKSMFFVTSESQLAEALRASARVAASGSFLTPQSLIALVQKGIEIKEKYDNSPAWLLLSLSRNHAAALSSTPWISRHFADYRTTLSQFYQEGFRAASGTGRGAATTLGGIVFGSVPRGVLVMGRDDNTDSLGKTVDLLLAHPVAVDQFLLSDTEITNGQYAQFADENPTWRASNRSALAAQGMATDTYLADWAADKPPAGRDEYPVTGVSYHAASAYCQWLTRRVQAAFPGGVARLPTEAEYEWAARGGLRGMPYPSGEKPGNAVFFSKGIPGPGRAGASSPTGYGQRDLMGNVWEWCSDSFGPADYLLTSLDPRKNAELLRAHPVVDQKAVRGGAWNNQRELMRVYTRGSQPSDWCTPFLGFRVAVSRP